MKVVSKIRHTLKALPETFIGIWKDREDMKNSSKWLRNVRKAQWGTIS